MTRGQLPPGQIETKRFPVVGERSPSPELSDPSDWSLRIGGLVSRPLTLALDRYLALPHQELTYDIHCVTSWTRFDSTWTGIRLSVLLEEAGPADGARYVSFTAFSARDHHTSLPLDVVNASSWLVHRFEGEPLSPEHGGPVRVVTPGKYFYKSIKWVKEIELLAEDRLGWWEANSSYHNNADPWAGDQRFTTGSLRPEQVERFLAAESYDKYRGRVMLGLDLRAWSPRTRDLGRLYLKHCDLSGLELSNADLRASNLSLSDLSGADLRGSDLSGSDLEGATFEDADLRGADLSGCALTATRFSGAQVGGAVFEGVWGLFDDERRYLVDRGARSVDSGIGG